MLKYYLQKKKIYLGDTSDLSTKVLWMDKILDDEKKNDRSSDDGSNYDDGMQ